MDNVRAHMELTKKIARYPVLQKRLHLLAKKSLEMDTKQRDLYIREEWKGGDKQFFREVFSRIEQYRSAIVLRQIQISPFVPKKKTK